MIREDYNDAVQSIWVLSSIGGLEQYMIGRGMDS
ncbi:hypothetical protein DSL72_006325 [Monilinia vaccinii-corymbosi]|uniref:Uncharacterized protein n=1 Tax=Monilinia vaccinii-corymbosi TaxID=61207 RepID=A0A8A3PNP3_9HELO|nr:hypothetical protein DSL72_006325 [Monilinia vaccinii-corymbosi]